MENKKHIVAITALVKNKKGDKFLVLKRSGDEIAYPGKWAYPGGKVEKGETIMEVFEREILEEAGIEIEDEKEYVGDYTFVRPDGHNVVGLTFSVKAKSEKVIIGDDFDDFKWVTPKEFQQLDFIKGMEKEVEKAFV